MFSRRVLFALTLLFSFGIGSCTSQPGIGKAQQLASAKWLALIDSRSYAASWDQSSGLFQKAISKENWVRQIASARNPMGQAVSRTLASSDVRENLAGQPEGTYTIFVYSSSFTSRSQAVETHTVYRADSSQPWQNAGYFIK